MALLGLAWGPCLWITGLSRLLIFRSHAEKVCASVQVGEFMIQIWPIEIFVNFRNLHGLNGRVFSIGTVAKNKTQGIPPFLHPPLGKAENRSFYLFQHWSGCNFA